MADIQITPTSANNTASSAMRTMVWITPLIGYQFYARQDTNVAEALCYVKTSNGGQTWGSSVKVNSSALAPNRAYLFSVWYDQWTPSDTGTKIHLGWYDNAGDAGLTYMRYRALDTSNDSLGTEVNLQPFGTLASILGWNSVGISVTKARGGNLHVWCRSNASGSYPAHWRSTDGGAIWTNVGNLNAL